MSSFQPGDRVVCVDAVDKRWNSDQHKLVLGDVYVLDDVVDDGDMVVMNGVYYTPERFVPIEVAQALGLLAGDVSKSLAEGQGFYSPETQRLYALLRASRDRVQQMLDKLAAVEAQRDHLTSIITATISGNSNLKAQRDHLTAIIAAAISEKSKPQPTTVEGTK